MTPAVVIVLLNWNGWRDTIACLESVLRLDYPNYRVVVCDNASTDDSLAHIRAWLRGEEPVPQVPAELSRLVQPALSKPMEWEECEPGEFKSGSDQARLTLIQTGANLGFAGGNNVGIRHALAAGETEFVWLLNNDTLVEPDALHHLVVRAQRAPAPGVVGSALCYMHAPALLQALGGASFDPRRCRGMPLCGGEPFRELSAEEHLALERRTAYVIGASMLVSRAYLEEVGLLAEDYFLYYEELDWAERAKGRYSLGLAAASRVYHKVGGSAGTDISPFSLAYLVRNQLRFTQRFYPQYLVLVRLQILLDGVKYLLKGQLAHARLAFKAAIMQIKETAVRA